MRYFPLIPNNWLSSSRLHISRSSESNRPHQKQWRRNSGLRLLHEPPNQHIPEPNHSDYVPCEPILSGFSRDCLYGPDLPEFNERHEPLHDHGSKHSQDRGRPIKLPAHWIRQPQNNGVQCPEPEFLGWERHWQLRNRDLVQGRYRHWPELQLRNHWHRLSLSNQRCNKTSLNLS